MVNREKDPRAEDKPRRKTNHIVVFVLLCLLVAAVVCFLGDDIIRLLAEDPHVKQFRTSVGEILS